jgi:hypothetical protein
MNVTMVIIEVGVPKITVDLTCEDRLSSLPAM